MGQIMCEHMTENGVPLKKSLFIFGNLVPDILVTFIFNKHSFKNCHLRLKTLLAKVYKASPAKRMVFSYYSGVAAHYICDFLCYAHTTAYEGNLRDHMAYEKSQTCNGIDVLPLYNRDSKRYDLTELIDALEERIARRVQLLAANAEISLADIPIAMSIASWAASAAYFYFNNSSSNDFFSYS